MTNDSQQRTIRRKYSTTYRGANERSARPHAPASAHASPHHARHGARFLAHSNGNAQADLEMKRRDAPIVSVGKIPTHTLRVFPLGGLEEIGKNCTAFEYGPDILVVDLGIMFPDEEAPGVDYIAPDTRFLQEHKDKIKGLVITHAHLDHVGAIPYLIEKLGSPPIYATELTAALIVARLEEFNLHTKIIVNVFDSHDVLKVGVFEIQPFRVNHNIPDSVGLGIKTPIGMIVHTGDFKFDFTPLAQPPTEFHKIASLGAHGVLLLLSDSTNSERPGYCISERDIAKNILESFKNAQGRVVISTFASLISRIQQIIDAAKATDRKVAISGRSLEQNLEICIRLGYIDLDAAEFIKLKDVDRYANNKVVIVCTGSQGQENSALGRMAREEHAHIKIGKGDTVILSSSPIPGNERSVQNLMNRLFSLGAQVIYDKLLGVHVSGHGYEQDLKLMHALVHPKYFLPVHGERHMLERHSQIAQDLGMSKNNIFVIANGQVIEFKKKITRITGRRTSLAPGHKGLNKDPLAQYDDIEASVLEKRLDSQSVMIDGLGVGDIGNVVLRDRQVMAQDGMVVIITTVDKRTYQIIGQPDIISRGFVYMKSSEKLIYGIKKRVTDLANGYDRRKMENWGQLRNVIRDEIGEYLFRKTERRPMVLPVIIQV